ncbi:MAG: dephospho-CoA kinase [Bacteroidia bacterium]|nr:dephospho-CoA kinase [Bacteroidia bacterium]
MLRLGVTGGIGSGKSTVCEIFKKLGVPVYNADQRSKFLVSNNLELQSELILHFGENAFLNGEYNRKYIADIVFNDASKLDLLNSIIHPYVLKDWDVFCSKYQNLPYIVKEAAIMLETDSRNSIDKVALVYASVEIRIERVMKRDLLDRNSILARIEKQMPESEKLKLADFIIYNDGSISLIEQVLKLHHDLLESN